MRRLLFAIAVLLPPRLHAQAAPELPQVVVTGRAELAVPADQAMVILSVESRQTSAAAAGAEKAQRMRAVRDALVRAGVDADSITSSTYSVEPNMTVVAGSPRLDGYRAVNGVRVRTRRLEMV